MAAPVMFAVVAVWHTVTASWGVATLGLLTVSASLFSAAAATSSAGTASQGAETAARAAEASLRSAQAAEGSEGVGRDALAVAQRSVDAAAQAHQLQLFERARAAHTDLTSGPVAAARGRLGAFSRAQRDHEHARAAADLTAMELARARRGTAEQVRGLRDDWFTLLWCIQRLRAVDEVLAREGDLGADPLAFLRRLVGPQLGFLNHEATYTRAGLEEVLNDPVDDHESKQDFIRLIESTAQAQSAARPRPGVDDPRALDATWDPQGFAQGAAPGSGRIEQRRRARHVGAWADTLTSTDTAARQRLVRFMWVHEAITARSFERQEAERHEHEAAEHDAAEHDAAEHDAAEHDAGQGQ